MAKILEFLNSGSGLLMINIIMMIGLYLAVNVYKKDKYVAVIFELAKYAEKKTDEGTTIDTILDDFIKIGSDFLPETFEDVKKRAEKDLGK